MKSITLYVLLGILLQTYVISALCRSKNQRCTVTSDCCSDFYCNKSLKTHTCSDCIKAGRDCGGVAERCCSRVSSKNKCCIYNYQLGQPYQPCDFDYQCCSKKCNKLGLCVPCAGLTRGCSTTEDCCLDFICDKSSQTCKHCIVAGQIYEGDIQNCCSKLIDKDYKCCNGYRGDCPFADVCCSKVCNYPGDTKDRKCANKR